MKIEVLSLTDEAIGERDYCDIMQILINGKSVFAVWDGEPEDNNLARNFNGCYQVGELLKQAFEAGKNGEELEYITDEVEEL